MSLALVPRLIIDGRRTSSSRFVTSLIRLSVISLLILFSKISNKHDQLQFGYMNVFQQLAAGNQYKSVSAARLLYFHNLDLRKKNLSD